MRPAHLAPPALLALLSLSSCPRFPERIEAAPAGKEAPGFVRVGSERVFVADQGSGPAVLLVHGYCGAHTHFAPIVPALARGHRVLAVDLPGFGRSDKLEGDYSPPALAVRLLGVLDHKGVRDVHVVGHSWGTSVALALALAAPTRVRSLTLVGVYAYEDQVPPFIVWSRAPLLGEALFTLFFDQRLDDRMALTFENTDAHIDPEAIERARKTLGEPGALAAALAVARGMRYREVETRYRTLRHPTLIIHGEEDRVTRIAWARRLLGELPQARLVVIPGARHMPMYTQPGQVLDALLPFLATVEQARPASRPTADERAGARGAAPASRPIAPPRAEERP